LDDMRFIGHLRGFSSLVLSCLFHSGLRPGGGQRRCGNMSTSPSFSVFARISLLRLESMSFRGPSLGLSSSTGLGSVISGGGCASTTSSAPVLTPPSHWVLSSCSSASSYQRVGLTWTGGEIRCGRIHLMRKGCHSFSYPWMARLVRLLVNSVRHLSWHFFRFGSVW